MKLLRCAISSCFLMSCLIGPAAAADAIVTPSTERTPDGCVRININVNPNTTQVKDVHLRVARTKDAANDNKTVNGDPKDRNYRDPTQLPAPAGKAGPATAPLPGGWTYSGPTSTPVPNDPTSTDWDVTWLNPNAALGGPFTFSVDYCGDKDVKAAGGKNIFVTSNGAQNFNPKKAGAGGGDVVGDAKGAMPLPVFSSILELPRVSEPRLKKHQ